MHQKRSSKNTISRISNFGLLEMTRQRLREGSINGKLNYHFPLFTKNIKKIQYLAFEDKVKKIYAYIPEKVKIYIEDNHLLKWNIFKKNIH